MWFEIQYQSCGNRSRWWVCVLLHSPPVSVSLLATSARDVITLRTTDSFLTSCLMCLNNRRVKRSDVSEEQPLVVLRYLSVYTGVQPGHAVSRHSQPPSRRQHGRPVYTLSPSLYAACLSLFFVGICTRITYRWLKRTRSRGFTIWSNCKSMVWGAFKSGASVSQRLAVCTCVYSGRVRSLSFLS